MFTLSKNKKTMSIPVENSYIEKNKSLFKLPLNSHDMMFAEALIDNSGLSVTNTYIANFYRLYFYNKILSIINIENLPDSINERYFKNTLLSGYTNIFYAPEYGVIANKGSLLGQDIYYNPTECHFNNPNFNQTYIRKIANKQTDRKYFKNYTALIKLSPNFEGVLPICYYYADLMAVAVQGIDSNVINSKLAYVFACENQTQAESFKKMFDEIANGYPAVFADKKLFNPDTGELNVSLFNNNVSNTFISDKLLELKVKIENEFNSYIGLNAVNTDKKERLITSEIELSNNNNRLLIELWVNEINNCLKIANYLFNLDIKASININDDINVNKGVDYVENEA